MAKRAKPLRAGRGRLRSGGDSVSDPQNLAVGRYPFAEISPRLKVQISPRARRMALRLDPKHRVMHLVVPKRASLRSAFKFAEENREWIREKLRALPRQVPFRDGAVLPVLGRDRQIVILYNETLKYTDIILRKDEIVVLTNKLDPSVRIKRFLIDLAKEKITEMSYEKSSLIRRRISDIQVKDTKSRWGSCSEDGKISFSWRLIFAPPKAMDYVIAHEVAHLVHLDHSEAFWDVCEALSRDYETGKDWMRDNGHDLMRFGE